eukprot:5529584-Alexandrium_andersonii.AAC.1
MAPMAAMSANAGPSRGARGQPALAAPVGRTALRLRRRRPCHQSDCAHIPSVRSRNHRGRNRADKAGGA